MKSILVRVLNRIGLLNYLSLKINVFFYSVKWTIPLYNSNGFFYMYGNSEEHLYKVYKKLFEKLNIDLFIDVGINLGQTLIKVKSISKGVKYVGFEPNYNCLSYVDNLIRLNNLNNTCQIIPVGLGKTNTVMKFYQLGHTDTRGSLTDQSFNEEEKVNLTFVPIFKLDDQPISRKLKTVVLKIDVEGFELDVLIGGLEFIKSCQPIILIEVLPHNGEKDKISLQKEMLMYFKELKYTVYEICSVNGEFKPLINLDIFNEFENDFIAIPNKKLKIFSENNES